MEIAIPVSFVIFCVVCVTWILFYVVKYNAFVKTIDPNACENISAFPFLQAILSEEKTTKNQDKEFRQWVLAKGYLELKNQAVNKSGAEFESFLSKTEKFRWFSGAFVIIWAVLPFISSQ